MNLRSTIAALTTLFVLSACGQTTTNPSPNHVGLIQVTFTGIGTQNFKATAKSLSNTGNVQSRTITDIANSIEIAPVARGSFDIGTRGVNGVRYLSATFKVRNADFCTPIGACSGATNPTIRKNLTFVAISRSSGTPTLDQSAVTELLKFDGSPAAAGIAQTILPTHGMGYNGSAIVQSGLEDFQAYKESEITSLQGVLSPFGYEVLPYGFVVRCINNCTANTRDLAASPAVGQYDGRVTFAVKMPLQATAAADPFSFSLLFDAVDDTVTRVTQSLEEQSTPTAVTTRAAALTGASVFRLPNLATTAPTACSLRTAGTVASPLAYLVNNSVVPATPALANTMFAGASAAISAGYGTPMNVGTSSTFTVNGSYMGKKAGTYGNPGNTVNFTPTAANLPNEVLEVTLTNLLSSASAVNACSSYTFRYRTAVATSSTGALAAATSVTVGASPRFATVGDLDNDGKLDLIAANTGTTISIRTGVGDGTFNAATTATVGSNPYSIVVADVNSDGKPDVITANNGGNNVSVLLNTTAVIGTVTFAAAVNYAIANSPYSVAASDVNGDGKLDLVTASSTGSNNVSVLIGTGTGTFATAVNYSAGTNPRSVALGDFNNDGKLDLVTSNNGGNTASVLLGNGDGTFATATSYTTPNTGYSVAVGDVNNDGKLDFVTASSLTTNNIAVLIGNGTGGFAAALISSAGNAPRSVQLADLNGDGKLDLTTANNTGNNVSVRFGNGDGTFGTATNTTTGNTPASVGVADLNSDGKLDVFSANTVAAGTVSVLLQ